MAGQSMTSSAVPAGPQESIFGFTKAQFIALLVMFAALVVAPFFLYPVFLMKLQPILSWRHQAPSPRRRRLDRPAVPCGSR